LSNFLAPGALFATFNFFSSPRIVAAAVTANLAVFTADLFPGYYYTYDHLQAVFWYLF
jgi:hypothetical protein